MLPTRTIAPFGLRLQPDFKEYLQQQAEKNHRSLNAEIIFRLEQSRTLECESKKPQH